MTKLAMLRSGIIYNLQLQEQIASIEVNKLYNVKLRGTVW